MPGANEGAGYWHYRRYLGAVDQQRGCSSHRQAFARIFGPPHTEILLKMLGLEPEAQSLNRCFHYDLDLSVLDLQFDHLQPNCAGNIGQMHRRTRE
jgi:hypothetical protein